MRRLAMFSAASALISAHPSEQPTEPLVDEYARLLGDSSRANRRANAKLLEDAANQAASSRPCGECSACCVTLGVHEINKVPGQRCRHIRDGKGCGIYSSRPKECRLFHCMWRFQMLGEEDRPDKSGVVLNPRSMNGVEFLMVSEIRAGAIDAMAERLDALAHERNFAIIVGDLNEQKVTRVFGPSSAFFELCMHNPFLVGLHIVQKVESGISWFVAKEAYEGSLKWFDERLRQAADDLGAAVVVATFGATEPKDIYGKREDIALLSALLLRGNGIGKA